MSATITPSPYQEKYARLPMIFASWTPSVNPAAPRLLAFATNRAGGLNTLSNRGLRGFEMSQKDGRPPFVSCVARGHRELGELLDGAERYLSVQAFELGALEREVVALEDLR